MTVLLLTALLLSESSMPIPGMTGIVTEVSAQSDTEEAVPDTRTYPTLDGGTHGMWSPDKELTIVLFMDPNCGYGLNLVKALRDINLSPEKTDICVVTLSTGYPDFDKNSLNYIAKSCPDFSFCYCEGDALIRAQKACSQYSREWNRNTNQRTMVFTDKNGVVKDVQCGMTRADKDQLANLITSMGFGALIQQAPDSNTVECEVTYGHTNARQMLARIKEFRTGDDTWEWNSTNEKNLSPGITTADL